MTFNNLCCFPLIVKFLERNAKRALLAVVQRVGRDKSHWWGCQSWILNHGFANIWLTNDVQMISLNMCRNKIIHIFLQYHEFKHMVTAISDSDEHFSVCATWQCLMGPIRKAGSSLSASSGTLWGWPVPLCHPRPFPVLPATPAAEGTGDLVFSRTRWRRITGTSGSPGYLWSASLWH